MSCRSRTPWLPDTTLRFYLYLTVSPITESDAQAISAWRYEPPYSVYDINPDAIKTFLEPRYQYHAAHDEHGDIIGYYGFGTDARVPAGTELDLYPEGPLDVGLGMRPDLTGHGLGRWFVQTGLEFATEAYSPECFRLTVATFNQRAIRVYEKCGFTPTTTFGGSINNEAEWLLMHKPV